MRSILSSIASVVTIVATRVGARLAIGVCVLLCQQQSFAQSNPLLPFPQNRVQHFYTRQAEQFLSHPPATPVEILPQFPGLDGGGFGHWGQNPEDVSFDHSLNAVDTGNVICQLTHHFGRTTFKAVNVNVDSKRGISVLFDPQQGTFVDAWQDGFVKWGFVRFGLMGGVEAAGTQLGDLTKSQWTIGDQSQIQYQGYYRYQNHVAFRTQVGNAIVLDSFDVIDDQLVRTLRIEGKLPSDITLSISRSMAAKLLKPEPGVELIQQDGETRLKFDGQPVAQAIHVCIPLSEPSSDAAVDVSSIPSTTDFSKGAPGLWTNRIAESKGVLGQESGPLAIDSLSPPHGAANPFRSAMRMGGVGCLQDGRIVVSTLMGEVWVVSQIDQTLHQPLRWQRIAAGLYQALGIVIQKDQILVLGSDQITRLHDLNADGETDFYECVTNRFPTTGGHDFCTSLQQDDHGQLYWAISSGDFGVAKMSSAGQIESLGNGLRNSNGIGVSRDGQVVLATVQEGTWTPASAIFEVGGHSYHGLKGPKEAHGKYGYDLPLCFLPRGLDNSSGEIGFLPEDARLGSLSGAAIGTSFGTCQSYLVLRDVVNGRSQGAVVPLPGDYLSGVCRVAFNTHDGCVYLAGTEGWQSYAAEDGCLHRIRLTKTPLAYPASVEAFNNGLKIRFTEPLNPASVSLQNTFCQQWNYLYSAGYGSPEFSVKDPGRQGHDLVEVKSVRLLPDGQSVFLEIPQVHPVMQFHAHLNFQTASGQKVLPDVFASLYEFRSDFIEFPEYVAVAKRRAPDFPIAEKYEQDPRLVQQERFGTDFGWVSSSLKISVNASAGLQFEPRVLRVAPGTRVSLAFRNGDPSMPHNVAVVKADDVDEFGDRSMQLASNPRAIATHYVPDAPAEICFSPILQPGDQYTMYFEAPKEPGEYRLVCTYPGHWRVMQGSLFVIPDGEPLPEMALTPVRKFVQTWTLADLQEDAESLTARNYSRGKSTFEEAGCLKCHKISDSGAVLGPDLTRVSERFRGSKLLQQILEPSSEVNKQYQTWVAVLQDGRILSGMLIEQNEQNVTLLPNPLKPETKVVLPRSEIEEFEASSLSTMPMSLLITFSREEILDMLAYVQAGGDAANPLFESEATESATTEPANRNPK